MTQGLWTRRRFLGALGASVLLPRPLFSESADIAHIAIFHTTDLHGHILPTTDYEGVPDLGGFARCASQIRAWRADVPDSILLDIGDVFQGTDVGLRTRGLVMGRCFDAMGYDAWVVGNHEFDWGPEAFSEFLEKTATPALSANASFLEKSAGFSKIRPTRMLKVGDFQIGVIGLTTPGLDSWFRPSFLGGFQAGDPAAAARAAADELLAEGADVVVLAGHMGTRPQGDDYANRVDAVTRAVPEAAVFLAGHTHRNVPSQEINGVVYSQANYFGIHVGRVDLFLDRNSRKVVRRRAWTTVMDATIRPDPAILSLTANDLEASAKALAAPAGRLTETFEPGRAFGEPGSVERLIASSILTALGRRQVVADAVLHGRFSDAPVAAGEKTVADIWKILPYENYVITGDLSPEQLEAVCNELLASGRRTSLQLLGLRVEVQGERSNRRVAGLFAPDGHRLDPAQRYRIAMNTYDASSAGQRLPVLHRVMDEVKTSIHPVQTREALIEFLSEKPGGVGAGDLVV